MTISTTAPSTPRAKRPRTRPWRLRVDQRDLGDLLPRQGEWTFEQYLRFTDDTNRLIELSDGWIEVLPMPTTTHQRISLRLLRRLDSWLVPRGGVVYYSPLRVRVSETRVREPDLIALLDADDPRGSDAYWTGADLAVEILSPSSRRHDLETKRADYAAAGITEYWIADPKAATLTVLTLDGTAYREHGVFGRGAVADSPLLPGMTVPVDEVFAAR